MTFTAWETDSTLPENAGNYYLPRDVTLTSGWTPVDGTVICLNGYTIDYQSRTDDTKMISVYKTLTVTDCQQTGVIKGQRSAVDIWVNTTGTFILYGGTLDGTGKQASDVRPGVANNGQFRMLGGKICDYEIGVAMTMENAGFTMEGGEISGNAASNYGGGVYCKAASVTVKGGSITGNNAGTEGGGLWFEQTEDSCMLTLGGTTEITGNFSGAVWDDTRETFTGGSRNNLLLAELAEKNPVKITVQDGFTGSAGICFEQSAVRGNRFADGIYVFAEGAEAYTARFTSDDPAYSVVAHQGGVALCIHKDEEGDAVCDFCEAALRAKLLLQPVPNATTGAAKTITRCFQTPC